MIWKFIIFLTTILYSNLLNAESIDCSRIPEPKVEIRDFFIKDFTMKTFIIQTKASDHDLLMGYIDLVKHEPVKPGSEEKPEEEQVSKIKFSVYVNGIPTDNIKGSYNSIKPTTTRLNWEVKPSKDEFGVGPSCIEIKTKDEEVLDRFSYTIPDPMKEPGQQPYILDIQPKGGTIGDTVTMKVQNPGKDLDKIVIFLLKPPEEQGDYAYMDKEACILFPYYLSEQKINNHKTSYHEVKFTLANYVAEKCGFDIENFNLKEKMFGRDINLKLSVNARPSKIETITLLNDNWKKFAIVMGLGITFLFMGLLAIFSQKLNFFPDIFLDTDTNTYSLANFQSFAWTIVLMGSYFYIAVCQGLILGQPELPEFNFSLIALLGVSYGGMITSNYVDKRKKHFVVRRDKPHFRDLIFDPNGGIDMARMQLFGFNLICLLLYVYYLLKSNPLHGLPSIPETLHSLLGTSQAGYIGSQAVTQMVTKSGDKTESAKEPDEKSEEEKPQDEETADEEETESEPIVSEKKESKPTKESKKK